MRSKIGRIVLLVLASLIVLGFFCKLGLTFPAKLPAIEMRAEEIPGLVIPIPGFPIPVTNSLLASMLTTLFLTLLAIASTRKMNLIPSGLQNLVEAAVEAIHNLVKSVAGEERAPRFFPWIASIFLFVLTANWLGLIPGLVAVGVKAEEQGQEMIIPFLRPPSTDLNLTIGLAIVSVTATQVYSLLALGPFNYVSRYFNIRGFIRFFRGLRSKSRPGCMGVFFGLLIAFVDLFTGALELMSEFAKIISFSFRLFGNLFGGKLILLVVGFIVPYLATVPFLAFEIIVGLMQAFVFAILTLIFMTMATASHEVEAGHQNTIQEVAR